MTLKEWVRCHAPFIHCLDTKNYTEILSLLERRYNRLTANKSPLTALVQYALDLTNEVQIMGEVLRAPEMQPAYMDRDSLKGTLLDLKAMGADVTIYKQDTVETLQAKLVTALGQLPIQNTLLDPRVREVQSTLSSCQGVLLDLQTPACVGCPNKGQCMLDYVKFLDGKLPLVTLADKEAERKASLQEAKQEAVLRGAEFNPRQRLVYTGQANLESEDSGHFNFFQAVCTKPPKTLASLKRLVQEQYEVEEDQSEALTIQFLAALVDNGYMTVA